MVNNYLYQNEDPQVVTGANRALNFISCTFDHDDWLHIYESGESCADQMLPDDDWPDLLLEAEKEGKTIALVMKQKTEGLPQEERDEFPVVRVNGVVSVIGRNDLLRAVCDEYKVWTDVHGTLINCIIY